MEGFKRVISMNKIVFNIDCLDGAYELKVDWDEKTLHYEIRTNIEYLEPKVGDLDSKEFNEKIEKVNIHKWNLTYRLNDVDIENPVLWKLYYASNKKANYIEGKEGNWPYTYDEFIDAIMLIDDKLETFKANKK